MRLFSVPVDGVLDEKRERERERGRGRESRPDGPIKARGLWSLNFYPTCTKFMVGRWGLGHIQAWGCAQLQPQLQPPPQPQLQPQHSPFGARPTHFVGSVAAGARPLAMAPTQSRHLRRVRVFPGASGPRCPGPRFFPTRDGGNVMPRSIPPTGPILAASGPWFSGIGGCWRIGVVGGGVLGWWGGGVRG